MWDIVLFEMIGTGIFAGACSMLSPVVTNETIIFIALVYFSCLVICTPISGGHLNPAYTLAVFILCNNKAAKVTKMLLMMLAQFLGTIIGFAFGRMVRVNIAVDTYYPAYYEPTPAIETLTTIDNYTPVLLFNEVFASSVLCLVFLSLKYRRDLIDKSRDQILNCAALALSLYAVTALTAQIIGLSFLNPVIALVQIMNAAIYIPQTVAGTNNLSVANQTIRCVAPFLGALIAALFFSFQVSTVNRGSPESPKGDKMEMGSMIFNNGTLVDINESQVQKEERKEEDMSIDIK